LSLKNKIVPIKQIKGKANHNFPEGVSRHKKQITSYSIVEAGRRDH
jgi:hypothetical protein